MNKIIVTLSFFTLSQFLSATALAGIEFIGHTQLMLCSSLLKEPKSEKISLSSKTLSEEELLASAIENDVLFSTRFLQVMWRTLATDYALREIGLDITTEKAHYGILGVPAQYGTDQDVSQLFRPYILRDLDNKQIERFASIIHLNLMSSAYSDLSSDLENSRVTNGELEKKFTFIHSLMTNEANVRTHRKLIIDSLYLMKHNLNTTPLHNPILYKHFVEQNITAIDHLFSALDNIPNLFGQDQNTPNLNVSLSDVYLIQSKLEEATLATDNTQSQNIDKEVYNSLLVGVLLRVSTAKNIQNPDEQKQHLLKLLSDMSLFSMSWMLPSVDEMSSIVEKTDILNVIRRQITIVKEYQSQIDYLFKQYEGIKVQLQKLEDDEDIAIQIQSIESIQVDLKGATYQMLIEKEQEWKLVLDEVREKLSRARQASEH